MTEDLAENDSSNNSQSTRRKVLKSIGGVGVGAALGLGGVYTVADQTDYVDTDELRKKAIGPEPPEKTPEKTEPDDTSVPRTTPWDKDNLVVSIDRDESLGGFDHVPVELTNATGFWNAYIEANVEFDLTLTFEQEASNPDILFQEESLMQCFGEYDSPATNTDQLTPLVCVETLRETPGETPVTPIIGKALNSVNLHRLVATHALGRLIGFDIWTEPVDVMTPKILFGPAHADHPDAAAILGTPSTGVASLADFGEESERSLSAIRVSEDLAFSLESVKESLSHDLEAHVSEMDQWTRDVEDLGYPKYVDAYEATVVTNEVAYLNETVTLISELLENNSNEDIEGSDELEAIMGRLEEMASWTSTREAWDLQIHRHYTDSVWSEWSDE